MTTTDILIGGAILVLVVRQPRSTFLRHLHADRTSTGRDLAQLAASTVNNTAFGAAAAVLTQAGSDSPSTLRGGRGGWGAGVRWVVSAGVRLAFLLWLYDITDGAAFSPFAFAQDVVGGTVWRPVLMVLGLTEVVAHAGAVIVRAVRGEDRREDGPAVPVETA